MKCALIQTAEFVGNEIFAHLAGSSTFGFFKVTSSSTFTCSFRCSFATTSLLIAACARTFTFSCLTTAGPGVSGNANSAGALLLALDFLALLVVVDFALAGLAGAAFTSFVLAP